MSEEEKQLALFLGAALQDQGLRKCLLDCNHPDTVVKIAAQAGFSFTAEAVIGDLPQYQPRGPWSPLGLLLRRFMDNWDANGFYENYREEGKLCKKLIKEYLHEYRRDGKIPNNIPEQDLAALISTLLGENGHGFSEQCVSRVLRHPLLFR